MTSMVSIPWRVSLFAIILALMAGCGRKQTEGFHLREGDRVVFLGDTLIEREQYEGWIEVMFTSRHPDRQVTFRNLGWTGDTPAGISRFGLSAFQATKSPVDDGWKQLSKQLEDAAPTVVVIGYGMAASFQGPDGMAGFTADYQRLLERIRELSPAVRMLLLGPIPHEELGPPWPDSSGHNRNLRLYDAAIGRLAEANQLRFISFFNILQQAGVDRLKPHLTDNGIHPNSKGYVRLAEMIEERLYGGVGPWRGSPQVEPLRQAILKKNEWFFDWSRPANMAYLFGFRKRDQGRNAGEIARFASLIALEEERIAQLRHLRPAETVQPPAVAVQEPRSDHAVQAVPTLLVAEGFEATLWAESPLLTKPIQMNFDPQGRLWLATSEIYPQIEPGQPKRDKIIVLEDVEGRGRADRATVFAEGLHIPTGILPGDGGVYVAQSTELLHYRDTDGDGRADVRRIVASGFGTEDTHHNLHTLVWGPDGRMYLNQSNNIRTHVETPHGVFRHEAGGVFRFDPRDQKMELLYRGWINPWGHQFDAFGQSFVTDGAGNRGINWGVPGATYLTVAPARRILESVSPGSYPKFCGLEIIRSSHFPIDWQGDMITCDFRAHRVVRFRISDQGAGYITQKMPDVVRSTSPTFRPVDVKLGPDGALYIADWSNPIIQHGEVDFRDPRRDKVHGRVWRIAVKGKTPLPRTDYTRLSTPALLDAVTSPDAYVQASARRVLLEKGDGAVSELKAWTQRLTDAPSLLAAIGVHLAFNEPVAQFAGSLFGADDPNVRAGAARALGRLAPFDALAALVGDPHPRVRLEAVRALGQHRTSQAASAALQVLNHPMDPFLDYALWLTINELAPIWAEGMQLGEVPPEDHLVFALKAMEPSQAGPLLGVLLGRRSPDRIGEGPWIELIGASGQPKELRTLFDLLLQGHFDEAASQRALGALADAARLRGQQPAGDLAALQQILGGPAGPIRRAAVQLARWWRLPKYSDLLYEIAGNPATDETERSLAFQALLASGAPEVSALLRKAAKESGAPAVRREALLALAQHDPVAASPAVIELLESLSDEAAVMTLWRGLLSIKGAGDALVEAIPDTMLSPMVAGAGVRAAREGPQNQALVQVLMKHAGVAHASRELTAADLRQIALEAIATGDPARGEIIYRRPELSCVACHVIGGAGGRLGPDLTSIGSSAQADYLLESLIYPNARIKVGYLSVQIGTRDNRVMSGIILRESPEQLELRTFANEVVLIPKADIESRADIGSLMPAGLVDNLLPDELKDLVKFMSVLGKDPQYDARRGGMARHWRFYWVTRKNQVLGLQRVVRGDYTLPDWKPVTSLLNGSVTPDLIEEAAQREDRSGTARGLYASVTFTPGLESRRVNFTLTGDVRAAWLNGVPIEVAPRFAVESAEGVNRLVLQLADGTVPSTAFSLEASGVTFLTD